MHRLSQSSACCCFSTQILINLCFDQHYWLNALNVQLYVRTAGVIQDIHKEIKARVPADGPERHSSTWRDLCVHVHVVFICTIGTVHVCTCVFMSALWRRPFPPSAMPVPTIRGAHRLPDRPLNPLPETLTAPRWEADPEGPEAPPHAQAVHTCSVRTHLHCSCKKAMQP